MHEKLDAFYAHLKQIITEKIPYPQAAEIINASYTHAVMNELLLIDDPRFSLFVELALIPELNDLLIDFFQIAPNMVTKPLSLNPEDPKASRNLLTIFKTESLSEMLEWIKHIQKSTSVKESASPNITRIQNDLILLIETNQFIRYKRHLHGLPFELIHQTIHQTNGNFIDAVLSADVRFIITLIELDISVLQVIDFNQRILDSLCEHPDLYENALSLIANKYKDKLASQDIFAVELALLDTHTQESVAEPVFETDLTSEALNNRITTTKQHGLFANKRFKKTEPDLLHQVLLKQTYRSGFAYPGTILKEESDSEKLVCFSL